MFGQVIRRLKNAKDARLFERSFLRARKTSETCSETATRLYCEGNDDMALAYELLDEKFPELYSSQKTKAS